LQVGQTVHLKFSHLVLGPFILTLFLIPQVLRGQNLADPTLNHLAKKWQLANPESMDVGVIGQVASAKVFVAPLSRIPDWSRLYWVEGRVLSEKYACLIRARHDKGLMSRYFCADKRQVVVWRAKGDNWIRFYGRQYNASGQEIAVVNRQVRVL